MFKINEKYLLAVAEAIKKALRSFIFLIYFYVYYKEVWYRKWKRASFYGVFTPQLGRQTQG